MIMAKIKTKEEIALIRQGGKMLNKILMQVAEIVRPGVSTFELDQMGEKWSKVAGKVQKYVEGQGYGLVRDLVGHGVGHAVHEEPQLPNYVIPTYDFVLREGMVLACEPMVTSGDYEIETMEDHWTVATKDRKYSAHFEHTFAITKTGCEVLTGK